MKCPSKEALCLDILSDLSWAQIAEKYGYSDPRFLRKKAKQWNLPPKRQIRKPSRQELAHLLYESHMSPAQIARHLGYSESGWSNIYAYCREYGLEVDFSRNKELHETPFSDRQKSIVYGTLLGDGYLRPTSSGKGNCSYALSCCHGEKQKGYLEWKFAEFQQFVTKKEFRVNTRPFRGNAPTYAFSTVSHPFLTAAHKICYPGGKKDITEAWLNTLTPLSLAVWYMDDGSINKRYHTIVLCTNSFSHEGQRLAMDYLDGFCGIETKLEKRRNNQTVIRINASQSDKFLSVVAPHIPDCMSYKLG